MGNRAAETERPNSNSVSQALQLLIRTVHTLRSYPAENDMCKRALSDLLPKLEQVVPLEIELSREGVRCSGAGDQDAGGDRSSIMEALYRDGIRRIQLLPGISADEVSSFLATLAAPMEPDDVSEDYVTRLWEAEFHNIRIQAVDPYLDLDLADDVLEGKTRPTVEQEDLGSREESKIPPPPAGAFEVSQASRAEIDQRIAKLDSSERWDRYVSALFDSFSLPVGERRFDELIQLLESTFAQLLRQRDFKLATKVIHSIQQRSGEDASDPWQAVMVRMAHPDRLSSLHKEIDSGAVDAEAVQSMLIDFGSPVADSVCTLLSRTDSAATIRFYSAVLVQLGPQAVHRVLTAFDRAEPDLQSALIRVLGLIKAEAAVPPLLRALAPASGSVRRETVRALAMIGGHSALKALLPIALHDRDSACRVLALQALSRGGTRLDSRGLIERIESRQFSRGSSEEKDLLFAAVGATGSDRALPVLERALKGGWFPGSPDEADQRRAASALRNLSTDAATLLLQRYASGRRRRAAICREALRERPS
jgi:HEAT repeat protein